MVSFFPIRIEDVSVDGSTSTRNRKVLKFVDDSKVIAAVNKDEDFLTLQDELKPIYGWSELNNMGWNNAMFKELRIGSKKDVEDYLLFTPGF